MLKESQFKFVLTQCCCVILYFPTFFYKRVGRALFFWENFKKREYIMPRLLRSIKFIVLWTKIALIKLKKQNIEIWNIMKKVKIILNKIRENDWVRSIELLILTDIHYQINKRQCKVRSTDGPGPKHVLFGKIYFKEPNCYAWFFFTIYNFLINTFPLFSFSLHYLKTAWKQIKNTWFP